MVERYGFKVFFETSAKRRDGVPKLADSIRAAIHWHDLVPVKAPRTVSPDQKMIVAEKEVGRVLQLREELYQCACTARPGANVSIETFSTCLFGLETAGLVKRLTFGGWVLLQPQWTTTARGLR
jgi:hypothetical protein